MKQQQRTPYLGLTVLYHHPIDGKDYPAMVLEIRGGPSDDVEFNKNKEVIKGHNEAWVCMLQIFRPRGNDWKWSSCGDAEGLWSWML